jgi:hypothetical protein
MLRPCGRPEASHWENQPGSLNLLRLEQFCQPIEANGYHEIFDLLFTSLGGDKAGNVEHLEKLILTKWQHPKNYLLPCVVFAEGGAQVRACWCPSSC